MKKDVALYIVNDDYFTIRKPNNFDDMKFIGKFLTSVILKFPCSKLYGKAVRIPLEKLLFKFAPSFWAD